MGYYNVSWCRRVAVGAVFLIRDMPCHIVLRFSDLSCSSDPLALLAMSERTEHRVVTRHQIDTTRIRVRVVSTKNPHGDAVQSSAVSSGPLPTHHENPLTSIVGPILAQQKA